MDENNGVDNEEMDNFRIESFSKLASKTDIEKMVFSQRTNLNQEKRKHLGLNSENILFEYTFDQLNSQGELQDLMNDLTEKDSIEKVIINGDLKKEELGRLIEILSDLKLPFTIVKDPDFKGSIGVEVERS